MLCWNASVLVATFGIVVTILCALKRVKAGLEVKVEESTSALRHLGQAQELIRASLAEKETLLKEVHHRVKNNLQVISSLLSLQEEKVNEPHARAVLQECRERIHLMGRLHQQLSAHEQFDFVDFGAHLREIAETLVQSHTPPDCEVALKIETDPVRMELGRAITLSLVANELIMNSLKHAFVGRRSGRLTVELHARSGENEMSVCDDGVGAPDSADPQKNAGLGTELVLGLTRQIRGTATFARAAGGGSCATVRFSSDDPITTPNAIPSSP